MATEHSELQGPQEWLANLRLDSPDGPNVALLPVGSLDAEPNATVAHSGDAATVRKILQERGITAIEAERNGLGKNTLVRKEASWIGPVVAIGAHFLSQNPDGIEAVLKGIAAYVTECVLDFDSSRPVQLEIVVKETSNEQYQRVTYKGPASGLEGLAQTVREARRGK